MYRSDSILSYVIVTSLSSSCCFRLKTCEFEGIQTWAVGQKYKYAFTKGKKHKQNKTLDIEMATNNKISFTVIILLKCKDKFQNTCLRIFSQLELIKVKLLDL